MAKTQYCKGMYVKNGKDSNGKHILIPIHRYSVVYGLYDNETMPSLFIMGDILDDSVEIVEEKIVVYDEKTKKLINLDDHVQVTMATIKKGHFTKLSGHGNEPRLKLAAPKK